MTKNSKIEFPRRLMWVKLGDLHVSPQAQREFIQSWGDHLLSEFDPEKFEPPHVNNRGERQYIVDGQHRIYALKRWLGDEWETQEVQAWCYDLATEDAEAQLFLHLSRNRKALGAFEDFRIALTAKEPIETDIERLVVANGQIISRSRVEGIGAVGTLKKVYKRSDPESFGKTVRIIDGAYGTPGFETAVIDGVSLLCQRYNGELDEAAAIEALGSIHRGVKGLMNDAYLYREKVGKQLSQCVAAAVVDQYNKSRRAGKLPGWFSA
jgi:hypothetical protein